MLRPRRTLFNGAGVLRETHVRRRRALRCLSRMRSSDEDDRTISYKSQAVRYAAQALSVLIPGDWRANGTFVPIPPSRVKDDPDHDPRVLAVLQAVNPAPADVRGLVLLRENAEAKAKNVSPHERAANYEINDGETNPEPEHLIIFDDVLAGASHFKATKMVLQARFQNATVTGLFLARSIRPNQELVIRIEDL